MKGRAKQFIQVGVTRVKGNLPKPIYGTACKESRVWQPETSGFCYQAGEFCSQPAQQASEVFLVDCNHAH